MTVQTSKLSSPFIKSQSLLVRAASCWLTINRRRWTIRTDRSAQNNNDTSWTCLQTSCLTLSKSQPISIVPWIQQLYYSIIKKPQCHHNHSLQYEPRIQYDQPCHFVALKLRISSESQLNTSSSWKGLHPTQPHDAAAKFLRHCWNQGALQ